MDRRSFLKGVFAAALLLGASQMPARADDEEPYSLKMYNTHTGEYMSVALQERHGYILQDMEKVNRFLRCHYTDEAHRIEPALLGLLARIDRMHGGGNLVHIISGYRSPSYNAILAKRSNGVASHSLHTKGMAVDFMLPGVGMQKLFAAVRSLSAGGAGIYPEFVHMDVGRVRTWGRAV
jgi:uncharacterized protein YcbK (DUF882 family)